MNKVGSCKLCNERCKLVNSHIIPKAFFPLGNGLSISKNDYTKKIPIGIYDQFLCKKCEDIFSIWDSFGAEFFLNKKSLEIKKTETGERVFLKKLADKKLLNMFSLSILFRADLSGGKFYEKVKLGTKFNKILKSIIEEEEDKNNVFSTIIFKHTESDEVYHKICYQPTPYKIGARNMYKFFLGETGYQLHIKVDSQSFSEDVFNVLKIDNYDNYNCIGISYIDKNFEKNHDHIHTILNSVKNKNTK